MKGSKARATSHAGMPGPSSSMRMTSAVSSAARATSRAS
jgi:hypothetical protein